MQGKAFSSCLRCLFFSAYLSASLEEKNMHKTFFFLGIYMVWPYNGSRYPNIVIVSATKLIPVCSGASNQNVKKKITSRQTPLLVWCLQTLASARLQLLNSCQLSLIPRAWYPLFVHAFNFLIFQGVVEKVTTGTTKSKWQTVNGLYEHRGLRCHSV